MKISPEATNDKEAPLFGKAFTVKPEYRHIPEASGLVWKDSFFQDKDEDDIVAVFDFDYSKMKQFLVPQGFIASILASAYFGGFILFAFAAIWEIGLIIFGAIVGLTILYNVTLLRWNVAWRVHAHHVAVTRDGIRFVMDKRRTWCGLSICDAGRSSKTVPFDKITDCDIEEPAGNACLCIPRILYTVNIDTASSSGPKHELQLTGLEDPHALKKLVWAMKRHRSGVSLTGGVASSGALSAAMTAPAVMEMAQRGGSPAPAVASGNGEDVVTLLKSIQQELKINNELLRKQQNQAPDGEIV